MCTKREHRDVLQGIADLVEEVPQMMHRLVMEGDSYTSDGHHVGGAWVGGYAFYSTLASV